MSRSLQRSLRSRDGCRSRSPRISALVQGDRKEFLVFGSKTVEDRDPGEEEPNNTRVKRIKKKHKSVTKTPDNEHCSTSDDRLLYLDLKRRANFGGYPPLNDKPSIESHHPFMPEKSMLELVVDILQRRDTYEIFAEPVDHKEVEDYFEVIKEPMDFGTMRAKLHEGMYTTLEQFEHDAFLIPLNAMHFNSTTTIFYRQARAIYELTKKVFHVLKYDPKNFESEFSGTRRRSARRPQVHGKSYNFSSGVDLGTTERTNNVNDTYTKGMHHTSKGPLRSSQKYHGFFPKDSPVVTKDNDSTLGARDGRTSSCEVNRRYTYEPCYNDNFGSIMNNVPKQLTQVSYSYIGYKESLVRFVEDLGPAAQIIANRKLQEFSKAHDVDILTTTSNCWGQIALENNNSFPCPSSNSAYTQKCKGIFDTITVDNTYEDLLALKPGSLLKTVIDLTNGDDGYGDGENMASENITLGGKLAANQVEGSASPERSKVLKSFYNFDKDNVIQEEQLSDTHANLFTPTYRDEDLPSYYKKTASDHNSISDAPTLNLGISDIKVQQQQRSSMLTFEKFSSQSNYPKRIPCSNWLGNSSSYATSTAAVEKDESSRNKYFSTLLVGKSNQQVPAVSPFSFDLPFLESRLNEMKSHSGLHGWSSSRAKSSNKNTTSGINNKCVLFPDTDLSLQL